MFLLDEPLIVSKWHIITSWYVTMRMLVAGYAWIGLMAIILLPEEVMKS